MMADYPRSGEFLAPIYDRRSRGATGQQESSYTPRAMQPHYGYTRSAPARPSRYPPGGGPASGAPFDAGAGVAGAPEELYGPPDSYYSSARQEPREVRQREELEQTPFFRKKVTIFECWQLFVMWMAFTGLLVYIGGLIGFRHLLAPTNGTTTTESTTNRATSSASAPGTLNGPCDPFTPCRDQTICVKNTCQCAPGQEAVENRCVDASNNTKPSESNETADTSVNSTASAGHPSVEADTTSVQALSPIAETSQQYDLNPLSTESSTESLTESSSVEVVSQQPGFNESTDLTTNL